MLRLEIIRAVRLHLRDESAALAVFHGGVNRILLSHVSYIPYDPLHPERTTTMEHLWSELKAWLDERDWPVRDVALARSKVTNV